MKAPIPKPLGKKAYGSIPHLPGSKRGPGDHGIEPKYAELFTTRRKSRYYQTYVQVKLDGSCVSVARENDQLLYLMRKGYLCTTSPFEMHHHFALWAEEREDRFMNLLKNGERACGEWLMEAHGTRYNLHHEPFVLFDIMTGTQRARVYELEKRGHTQDFTTPYLLHGFPKEPIGIEEVVELLKTPHHGELDPVEGAVWRLEHGGQVIGLAKYVRPEATTGIYLKEISGKDPIYNWRPS